MLYHIYHNTQFSYQQWVSFSHNLVRLKPRNTPIQTVVDFSISVDPTASETEGYNDYFGNHLHHLLIREPHHFLNVIAKSCVAIDMEAIEALDARRELSLSLSVEEAMKRLSHRTPEAIDAKQYTLSSPLLPLASEDLEAYARLSFHPERSMYLSIQEFMGRIFEDFKFVPGFSDLSTPVDEVFEAKKGVCQDFAHLAITALRSLGLPTRYMSGYIETIPPKGQEKLFGSDASHAWFSVYLPELGWFDFDPTNNIVPRDQHILLGYGRDYSDISPIQGVVQGSGLSHLNVMVDVSREEVTP